MVVWSCGRVVVWSCGSCGEDEKKQKRLANLQKAREARAQNQANKRELEVLRAQLGGRQAGPKIEPIAPVPVRAAPQRQVEEVNYGFIIDQVVKKLTAPPRAAPKEQVQQRQVQQAPEDDMAAMFNFS